MNDLTDINEDDIDLMLADDEYENLEAWAVDSGYVEVSRGEWAFRDPHDALHPVDMREAYWGAKEAAGELPVDLKVPVTLLFRAPAGYSVEDLVDRSEGLFENGSIREAFSLAFADVPPNYDGYSFHQAPLHGEEGDDDDGDCFMVALIDGDSGLVSGLTRRADDGDGPWRTLSWSEAVEVADAHNAAVAAGTESGRAFPVLLFRSDTDPSSETP